MPRSGRCADRRVGSPGASPAPAEVGKRRGCGGVAEGRSGAAVGVTVWPARRSSPPGPSRRLAVEELPDHHHHRRSRRPRTHTLQCLRPSAVLPVDPRWSTGRRRSRHRPSPRTGWCTPHEVVAGGRAVHRKGYRHDLGGGGRRRRRRPDAGRGQVPVLRLDEMQERQQRRAAQDSGPRSDRHRPAVAENSGGYCGPPAGAPPARRVSGRTRGRPARAGRRASAPGPALPAWSGVLIVRLPSPGRCGHGGDHVGDHPPSHIAATA